MPDFWSNPAFARSSSYVTFNDIGDTVRGVVTALREQTFADGRVAPQIELATADGPRTLTAGQIRLQTLLIEHRPRLGDELTVTMTGSEKRPNGGAIKRFEVSVVRAATGEITETRPATFTVPIVQSADALL